VSPDCDFSDDVNTSGIWEPVRSFASNKDKLADIAFQAHSKSWMANNSEVVKEVFFETHTLPAEGKKYDDIQIDLIKYSVTRTKYGEVVRGPRSFFYLSKGMKPDCVYYCWARGLNTGQFFLDEHICNIVMPTA
jgi:hypothetical protein